MAAFINTNIASLNAQRNLNSSQGALQTSLQRLSSGLRINSAKDDAAGLAIADRFTTQIRGLNQAVRNANDGISLSQTAEGALGEMGNNLQRIRELAVQAANSTNSDSDRKAINEEVQQRLQELDRTASQTSFNGQKILDGSFGSANFQIGANAGETIGVNLSTSMRADSIGKIATVTSTSVVGGPASMGKASATFALGDFSTAATPAQEGKNVLTVKNLNFSQTASAGSKGSLAISNLGADTDFTTAATVQGMNVQNVPTDLTYSGAGNLAQFNVTDGTTTVGITLNQDYANAGAMAADIQTQLRAVSGLGGATADIVNGKLELKFNNGNNAIQVTNADSNAVTAGFANSTGLAGGATDATSLKIDNITVNLNAAYADNDAVANAIQTQLNNTAGAGAYSVSFGSGSYSIINNTVGSNAPTITANNAQAYNAGWGATANTTQANGTAAVSSGEAQFRVDGVAVSLTGNYANLGALASDLDSKLASNYSVDFDEATNSLTIKNGNTSGNASTGVVIDADPAATASEQASASNAGFLSGVSSNSVASNPGTNKSMVIDGKAITLNQDYSAGGGVGAEKLIDKIKSDLGDDRDNYNISYSGGSLTIESKSNTAAPAVSSTDFTFTATAGSTGNISISDLSINGVSIASNSYKGEDLAARINSQVIGVHAAYDSTTRKMSLTSANDIKLGGSDATGALGFASTEVAANNGALKDVNTLTDDAANETIQRIDSALASVNSLRSTFGAVQNRFESVISNLSSTSENLSAARSRIQDADFAAETATLTRGQILQQAGTAMLAQANQLPNGVMALLRG